MNYSNMVIEPTIDGQPEQISEQKALKNAAKKRRLELLEVIKKTGFKNARGRVKIWAKHYGIGERAIYTDFKFIQKRYKPSEIEEIKLELSIARDQALNQSLDILSKPGKSDSEKLETIKVVIVEREGFMVWKSENTNYLVDHAGVIFKETEDTFSLPVVMDKKNEKVNLGD